VIIIWGFLMKYEIIPKLSLIRLLVGLIYNAILLDMK